MLVVLHSKVEWRLEIVRHGVELQRFDIRTFNDSIIFLVVVVQHVLTFV